MKTHKIFCFCLEIGQQGPLGWKGLYFFCSFDEKKCVVCLVVPRVFLLVVQPIKNTYFVCVCLPLEGKYTFCTSFNLDVLNVAEAVENEQTPALAKILCWFQELSELQKFKNIIKVKNIIKNHFMKIYIFSLMEANFATKSESTLIRSLYLNNIIQYLLKIFKYI